jgi:hypothetical protein
MHPPAAASNYPDFTKELHDRSKTIGLHTHTHDTGDKMYFFSDLCSKVHVTSLGENFYA